MDLSGYGTPVAIILTALTGFFGVMFKRSFDKRMSGEAEKTREDAARKAQRELDDKRASEVYDQMQEDRAAERTEMRAMRDDINKMNLEMTGMWSKMAAMRRTLESYEAHIAAWNRWADGGSVGPRPAPVQGIVE